MLEKLGDRIRILRKERKLTLVEIAQKTGIAQATLSRIETGTMTGTVESHAKIADAIGIGLAELYSGIDQNQDAIVHKKKEEESKVVHHSQSVQIELLTSESSKKKITPYLLTLQPNGQTSLESAERGVEKFFFVIEGEVKATIGTKEFFLKPNDTLYFDASLAHAILNDKKNPAKILAAVSPSKL